jgi:hypothetical protein
MKSGTPCGAAGAPLDALFPKADGTLEQAGHDVFAWANALATSALTIPATSGDVMGYCNPVWASAYTYRAVLAFRGATVLASRAPNPVTRVLVVRGSITNGKDIALEPAFTLDARPTPPASAGEYVLEGLDIQGQVLFLAPFTPFVLDHAPELRPFMVAVPSSATLESTLVSLVVRGPAGVRRLESSGPSLGQLPPAIQRGADGTITATCGARTSRGIAVLRADGSVVGSAPAASMRLTAPAGTSLSVVCSDGVRTMRSKVVAPQ